MSPVSKCKTLKCVASAIEATKLKFKYAYACGELYAANSGSVAHRMESTFRILLNKINHRSAYENKLFIYHFKIRRSYVIMSDHH